MAPIGATRAVIWGTGEGPTEVTRFSPSTFTTGDAVWSDDIRSNDMSLTGDLQESTLSDGSPSIASDGTDDHGLFSLPSEMDGSSMNSWAVEMEVQYTATGRMAIFSATTFGSNELRIFVNSDTINSDTNGTIVAHVVDDSGAELSATPSTNPNLDDGNKHTIIVKMVDASSGNMEIVIDGTSVSLTYNSQGNLTSWATWSEDMGVFAENFRGSIQNYYEGDLGTIRLYGDSSDV